MSTCRGESGLDRVIGFDVRLLLTTERPFSVLHLTLGLNRVDLFTVIIFIVTFLLCSFEWLTLNRCNEEGVKVVH